MKILSVRELGLPEVKVVAYARFGDERGYFTETFRTAQLEEAAGLPGGEIAQINESFSRAGVFRGLHAQWNPFQGKVVRVVSGRLVDMALDLRKGSPTFGRAVAHELAAVPGSDRAEWIWVPPGFVHGVWFVEDSTIEYLCSAPWSPGCEVSIDPTDPEIDWSPGEPAPARTIREGLAGRALLSDKDRAGLALAAWLADPRSAEFTYDPAAPFGLRRG